MRHAWFAFLALVLLEPRGWAVEGASADSSDDGKAEISTLQSNRGAAASPVELVPRLEVRQSFVRVNDGASLHDTTTEIDILFLEHVLLRYEGTIRVLATPDSQTTGLGDIRLQALVILGSNRRFVAGPLVGTVLDTASQPKLGAGKQQLFFGGGAAFKPFRWWLLYLIGVEQFSVGGNDRRSDVNVLAVEAGTIVFGRGQTWYKLDLQTAADFEADNARLFGLVEVGRLLFRKTGLFLRAGTQLAGPRQVDYSLEVGARYLFRLDE